MRRLAIVLLLALPLSCTRKPADFSGLWRMTETDEQCRHEYSQSWLRIEQEGDRATIHSWGGDGWSCSGRGVVEGAHLKFRWGGDGKQWRGTADLERSGNEVHGTYKREETVAAVQYCRGVREERK